MNGLARYAGAVVGGHIAVVFWHLVVVSKIHLGLTVPQIAWFTFLVSVLPITAVVLLGRGYNRLGGWLLVLALGMGLCIGAYEHFLGPGPDNVFRMPPGEYTSGFRLSSVLLLVLELAGCVIGGRAAKLGASER